MATTENSKSNCDNRSVLHLTVRLAWHDSCWNGKLCEMPRKNIYCVGNYSLLSTRIQRRKNSDLEHNYSGEDASEIIKKEGYIPPCYWVINLLGDRRLKVKHVHPFCDFSKEARDGIKPIEDLVEPHSVLSWCFKFSFAHEGLLRYPPDLEDRLEHFLSYIVPNKSLVLFYLNYSNPVNGDRNRYLIVGAALVKDVKKPKRYVFDSSYYEKLKKKFGGYFPDIEWSFQIILDPDTIVMLPYQEYVKMRDGKSDEALKRKIDELLNEIAVEVDKQSLIPHFKYVSMHIPTDKALYILYEVLESLEKALKHGIVERELIETHIERCKRLIKHMWELRGEYPSLKKVLIAFGEERGLYNIITSDKHPADYKQYRQIEMQLDKFLSQHGDELTWIIENDDIDKLKMLLESMRHGSDENTYCSQILREMLALARIRGNSLFTVIKVLSRIDLTYAQILNILRKVGNKKLDINSVINEVYSLVYDYIPRHDLLEEQWFTEFMDFDIDLYLLDIPLIPDPTYSKSLPQSSPKAPGRLIAAIYEALRQKALLEGITAVKEDELINTLNEDNVLRLYRGIMPQVTKSDIEDITDNFKHILSCVIYRTVDSIEGPIYQLKIIREMERAIEEHIREILKKSPPNPDPSSNKHSSDILESLSRKMDSLDISNSRKKEFLKIQKAIYNKAVNQRLLIITGGAGTGKTETIINLVDLFSRIGKKPIYIVTPTGKSSLVIRDRLNERKLLQDRDVDVLTMHRLLYSYPFEDDGIPRKQAQRLVELIDMTFNDFRFFSKFKECVKDIGYKVRPEILIIDEASMVDEVLMALLSSIVDTYSLEHLIIVGDNNQLPPIGLGKPFIDIIDFLNEKYGEKFIVNLTQPIRFSTSTGIWAFSQAIACIDYPINDIERYVDETFKIEYFLDENDLKEKIRQILLEILGSSENHDDSSELLKLLNKALHLVHMEKPELDKVQILTPTRYGELGAEYINRALVLGHKHIENCDYVKLINEQNRYVTLSNYGRLLLIPNGSLGYWVKEDKKERIEFEEVREFKDKLSKDRRQIEMSLSRAKSRADKKMYYKLSRRFRNDNNKIINMLKDIKREIKGQYKEGESHISPAYAITVHKSQGSDFYYVILVLSRVSSFTTKELMYTALTRARKTIYLLLKKDLKDRIASIFQQIKSLSETEKRQTLLFKYRRYPGKTYVLKLKDGKTIYVRSKIEYMIAKTLDDIGVKLEYEPNDFKEYGIIPDFKVMIDGKVFYIEHLGLLDKEWYSQRWEAKRKIYEKLKLLDQVITTSEPKEASIAVEETIKRIVNDIRKNNLVKTKDGHPSKHHYILCENAE